MVLVAAAAAATVETKTSMNLVFLLPCPRHYVSFFQLVSLSWELHQLLWAAADKIYSCCGNSKVFNIGSVCIFDAARTFVNGAGGKSRRGCGIGHTSVTDSSEAVSAVATVV